MTVEACPGAEDWSAFVAETLDSARRDRLSAHVGECPHCRTLVASLVAVEATAVSEGSGIPVIALRRSQLATGTKIGRYVVERPLGAGGMGVVYVARDPELDRRVAIKLLAKGSSNERLRREAQALAKLDHANVVTVYDVGEHDGQSFVAMALVDGKNLRAWGAAKHTTREVLHALLDAGRGVAAAHAVGLIHRDLKPDNMFVADRGQVMVGDFGLARTIDGADEASHAFTDADTDLTMTGAILGTPAYMAPEQARGEPTMASDQFAFCVTAWELLYGVRPFTGSTFEDLLAAVQHGAINDPPGDRGVPARVRRVLVRGLAAEPAARWPSMEVLLHELSGERARRRRNLAIGAGSLVAVTSIVFGFARATTSTTPPPRCRTADDRLAPMWSDARRAEIRSAVLAVAPFAQTAVDNALANLDAYATRWRTSWDTTCAPSGEVSDAGFDLRVACLEQRLRVLTATTDTLSTPDREIARRVVQTTTDLPSIDQCDDVVALRKVAPPPPHQKDQIAALDAAIARADAQRRAGKLKEALVALTAVETESVALKYVPTRARATFALGIVVMSHQRFPEAKSRLEAALNLAVEAGDDYLVAGVYVALAGVAVTLGDVASARQLSATADAAVRRIGNPQRFRDSLMSTEVLLAVQEGKYAESLRLLEGLILQLDKEGGRGITLAAMYKLEGTMLLAVNRPAEARAALDRSIAKTAETLGTRHPDYADQLRVRGFSRIVNDEFAAGLADLELSYKTSVDSIGTETVQTAGAESLLGQVDATFGRYEAGITKLRHVIAVQTHAGGPDSAAISHRELATILRMAGRLAEADTELQQAFEIHRRNTEAPQLPWDDFQLARLRFAQHRLAEATTAIERARVALEKLFGADNPELADVWNLQARVELARNRFADAVKWAKKAIRGPDLGEAKLVLAQALLNQRDPAGAKQAVTDSIAALDRLGPTARPDLRKELAALRP